MILDDDSDEGDKSEDIRLVERYDIDPSIQALRKLFARKGIKRIQITLDERVNHYEAIEVPIREDYRKFIKLFYSIDTEKAINKLNHSSFKLLYYIMKNLKFDSN